MVEREKRTIDLFAGIRGWGGDGIGLELDADACATAKAAGYQTVRADVTTFPLEHLPRIIGLTASPPCQTFSAGGNRDGIADLGALVALVHACVTGWHEPPRFGDPRTGLVLEPLRYTLTLVPDWLALEQVPDVLPVWEAYAYTLRAHGWSVWTGILNSADFGVPQTRRRAILMAHRSKIVQPPAPTHCEGGASTMFGELAPWVSMADALGWQGFEARYHRGAGMCDRHGERPARDCDLPAPTLMGSALGAGAGAKLTLHTNRGQDDNGARQTRDTDAPAPALSAKAGGQWAFDRPSTSVCATDRVGRPGHEDWSSGGESAFAVDAIKLTVEDALTLQSFPADYPVRGTKTSAFRQVGNAIPPLLARHVLAAVSEGSTNA